MTQGCHWIFVTPSWGCDSEVCNDADSNEKVLSESSSLERGHGSSNNARTHGPHGAWQDKDEASNGCEDRFMARKLKQVVKDNRRPVSKQLQHRRLERQPCKKIGKQE